VYPCEPRSNPVVKPESNGRGRSLGSSGSLVRPVEWNGSKALEAIGAVMTVEMMARKKKATKVP
jgi:hypothetical protein